jgi:alpha-ketoglutaric semialdehyde dehydrogenase
MELQYRIGTEWAAGEAGDWADDTSPSDVRDVIARYRLMSRKQVDQAVAAAIDAFGPWKAMPALARAAILSRAAVLLRQRRDDHARTISRENGKTLAEATVEVDKSADFLDFYAATARMPSGGLIADARPDTRAMAIIEPIGVIAMITPWNDPMITPARKLGPALISGCTVLLKPARETPLAADFLVRALVDAGLPAGVLNTVITDHATFDDAVISHPRLAGVTFTGSTAVGLSLSRKLAGRTVRLQTEMGGKNASVVLADADLDLAVTTLVGAAFGQAGQRCTATSRVVVEDAVHDAFVSKLCAAVKAIKIGPSLNVDTKLGPMINRRQQSEVLAHIEKARAHGGQVVAGGEAPADEAYRHGCFVAPTVVTGVTPEMPLWREEVFGPVLAICRVATFEEAVAAVNDSDYGLSAALFTNNLRHAQRFIDAVDTGQVAVNLPTSGWDVHQPFGGFKESGSPFKEQGLEGLRFYTRIKMAAIRFAW